MLRQTVSDRAAEGQSFIVAAGLPEARAKLMGAGFTGSILTSDWKLPSGAFRENNGPC